MCEVQMLLRKYRDVRAAMHEPYKIVRAGKYVAFIVVVTAAAAVVGDGGGGGGVLLSLSLPACPWAT